MTILQTTVASVQQYKRVLLVGLLVLLAGFVIFELSRPKPEPSLHVLSDLTNDDVGTDSHGKAYRVRTEYKRTYDFQKPRPWWCAWVFKDSDECMGF